MTVPVFVIHGVANRDLLGFGADVAALGRALGDRFDLRPVYWGDLGANHHWLDRTIPRVGIEGAEELRDGLAESGASTELAALFMEETGDEIRDGDELAGLAVLSEAAIGEHTDGGRAEELRDDAPMDADTAAVVVATIAEQWPETVWLRHVTDRALLREVGVALAGRVDERDGAGEEVRGPELSGFVRARLAEMDRVVGAAFGAAGTRLNTVLRTKYVPGVAQFFGDVLVYQRHQARIHDRVRSVIAEVDPGLGRSQDHPVRVIAHSLGGVIAVDMATSAEPLWTSSLVTCGSQSPFFHVCDPRGGQLLPFQGSQPVVLPRSLGAWTNLWEPMDMLAFIAANVFRLHDGSAPVDVPLAHLASSGLWTHSAYWHPRVVAEAIGKALENERP
jgi:hypothetical protein